ncbi:MAG: hypothetical protein GQE15_04495 [Archangiaceae bacterium]|nr:hypothetical protein [Archangiaceae bacterium]
MRGFVVGSCLLSAVAVAQPNAPTVAPYPLEVLARGVDGAKVEELQAVSSRLLVTAGVTVQPKLTMKSAVERLKRQDCSTEDDCLRQLAILANALYGLYSSVEATPKSVTVSGRVVRDDGKRVSGPEKVVEDRKPGEAVDVVAKRALPKLFAALKVAELPSVRESATPVKPVEPLKPVEPVKPPEVKPVDAGVADAGVNEFPPPPPPPALESPLKPIGLVTAIAGGALLVGGSAVLLVGRGEAATVLNADGALKAGGTADDATKARAATTTQTLGATIAAVGAAAGAAGLVMLLLAPAEPTKTTMVVAPVPGGAAVLLTGELP